MTRLHYAASINDTSGRQSKDIDRRSFQDGNAPSTKGLHVHEMTAPLDIESIGMDLQR
jgi:hypothetical protein